MFFQRTLQRLLGALFILLTIIPAAGAATPLHKVVFVFAGFNERIRRPGGFHLTTPPRERIWNTPTGRANFMVFPGVSEDEPVKDPAMLRLATLRSHDQYNTTIYTLDDRYRGVFGGRMVVFMNEADMLARGIAEGDLVEIESLADDKHRVVGGFWAKTHSIAAGSVGA